MFPDLTWLFWSFALGAIVILLNYIMHQWQLRRRTANIPGPPGLPLIGNTFDFVNVEPTDFMPLVDKYWESVRPSGILRIKFPFILYVQFASADYVQIILSDKEQINKSADYDMMFKEWLGNGLLLATGQQWHTRRKLLTPAFHFRILEDFIDVINYHSTVLVEKFTKEIGKKSFVVYPYITLCTLDIICETSMGQRINAQLNENSDYLHAVEKLAGIAHNRNLRPWYKWDWLFNMTSMGRETKECLKILHGFTDKVIQERKLTRKTKSQTTVVNEEDKLLGKKKRTAFLDMVLDMAETDNTLTDESIRDEVDTFMFGGHDTTGSSITWSLFLIGNNPDVQKKIQEELDSVLGEDPATTVTPEHLKDLKYLERAIKESLRLFPPAHIIGRQLMKDMKFGEYVIPKGVSVMVNTYVLHRNPDEFPDPEKYDPDRFLPEAVQKRHPYAYVPFSAGPRNCIGQKFALMEMKIILAHIFRSYKVKSLESREEMKVIPDAIIRPKSGVLLKIEPRVYGS